MSLSATASSSPMCFLLRARDHRRHPGEDRYVLPSATKVAFTRGEDLVASPINRLRRGRDGTSGGGQMVAIPKARSSPRSAARAVTQVFAEMPICAVRGAAAGVVRSRHSVSSQAEGMGVEVCCTLATLKSRTGPRRRTSGPGTATRRRRRSGAVKARADIGMGRPINAVRLCWSTTAPWRDR